MKQFFLIGLFLATATLVFVHYNNGASSTRQLQMLRERITLYTEQQRLQHQFDGIFHEGDLIFHTSLSAQSQAIQLATHSPYSHCGLLYKDGGEWQVFEAVQPVKLTPLAR